MITYRKVESALCALPSCVQIPVMVFMLALKHKPYGVITSLYWNLADHQKHAEFWWHIQTKYKTASWH